MDVREATRHDAADLQQIMADTPQSAGRLILSLVNAPDFFGRAQA